MPPTPRADCLKNSRRLIFILGLFEVSGHAQATLNMSYKMSFAASEILNVKVKVIGARQQSANYFVDIHSNTMHSVIMLEKELIAASTEPLILSLLSSGESYGYALIQEVKRLSEDKIEWTDGMLYPVLH